MTGLRIDYLLAFLGTDNSRLSAYAGCSGSNFSRLRSGSRKLTPHSSTVKRFAQAVYTCACDNDLTPQLCALIGCNSTGKDEAVGRLIEWLFESDDISSLPKNPGNDPAVFGRKLDSVMRLTEMTNSRLARLTNVDASYISRMRSGQRMPKNNPELIDRICTMLTFRAAELGRVPELSGLIGISHGSEDTEGLTRMLAGWLTDRSSSRELTAVKRFISSINLAEHIPEDILIDPKVAAPLKILNEKKERYIGISGLRRGSVRLLGNAIRHGSETLMLYSDISQRWMGQDFFPVWLTLMYECLKKGMKIWVIHHIDRATDEMIDAIHKWMPLYMSGLIEPYYCTLPLGQRFSTALFSDPGRACLSGQCVVGCEDEAIFRYATDPDELTLLENEICSLISESRPLLKHLRGLSYPEGDYKEYTHNGIKICVAENSVYVCKLTEPQMTFALDHPKMVSALKAYTDRL